MPDEIFANSKLAEIYDDLDADRSDLDLYIGVAHELGARSVLDIGCGTGSLPCLLTAQGFDVIGVDPADASLVVARRKRGADAVRWLQGDATTLPPMAVDIAMMTGNVAQVFVTDEQWFATLHGVGDALVDNGRLVFESRDPAFRAWEGWNREATLRTTDTVLGPVESWVDLTDVAMPLVSFRWTYRFVNDATTLTSDSTLRFRGRDEIDESLSTAGFTIDAVRDAPDRPGREFVFIAHRAE